MNFMAYAEQCFWYTKIPEESDTRKVYELTAWPNRKCSPSDELVNYVIALLLQKLDARSDSMGQANVESFLRTYNYLLSLTDANLIYQEVSRCIDVAKMVSRAEKYKICNDETLNARAEAPRYGNLIRDMQNIPTLKKVLIETLEVGRDAMNPGPRAIIANALDIAAKDYGWSQFTDDTSLLCILGLSPRKNGHRRYRPL